MRVREGERLGEQERMVEKVEGEKVGSERFHTSVREIMSYNRP